MKRIVLYHITRLTAWENCRLQQFTRFILLLVLTAGSIRCTPSVKNDQHTAHDHAAGEQYTCPMHPNVMQDKPGTCPVCGMDLVKVAQQDHAAGNELMLTDSQIRLANITTQPVVTKNVGQTLFINGTLTVNEQQSEVISSRTAGRVEKLYVRETGQTIQKGKPLYTVYSELLLTLQQEYLLAKEQYEAIGQSEKRYKSFLDAAERKLRLYGLTSQQIQALRDRQSLQPQITFLAPSTGVVTEITVTEGQYISEGQTLYRIEDMSELWVEAELYPQETSFVRVGDKIEIRVNGFENTPVEATVTFLSPEFRASTQITVMRASIKNPQGKFKPGQQAQVYLTRSSKQAIAIPVDAVIRDGNGAHVYVQSGRNTFRPQMVKTGLESYHQIEITEGLHEGDTVAVSGAYLLYSEIILKKGNDPMAGHSH